MIGHDRTLAISPERQQTSRCLGDLSETIFESEMHLNCLPIVASY